MPNTIETPAEERYRFAFVRLRSRPAGDWLVHPELRSRLVADATEAGTNLTEVAVKILSEQYKVPFHANGRKAAPKDDQWELNLRLPWSLYEAAASAQVRAGRTSLQDELRFTLCAHYGLRVPERPPRRRAAA